MALRSCPRCYKEIPDEAVVCPHCHTELTKCHKCGALALKNTKNCSKCGTHLPRPNSLIESPEVSVDMVVNHVNDFTKKSFLYQLLANQMFWNILCYVFSGLSILIIGLFRDEISFLIGASVMIFGYSVASLSRGILVCVVPKRLAKYTESTGFDIDAHIVNGSVAIQTNTKSLAVNRKTKFELAKNSRYAKACPNKYKTYSIFGVVKVITFGAFFVGMIFSCVFLGLYAAFATVENSILLSPPAIVFYVFDALELISIFVFNFYEMGYNRSRDEWMKTEK